MFMPAPDISPRREENAFSQWQAVVQPIEGFLEACSSALRDQVREFDPEIVPYAEYALTNQGKQLRPLLVGLSGAAAGASRQEPLVAAAVIIEMVHLATLVHDDVMDEAELRRKRPTLAANWGNEISVLLGDCLFAHALKLAASFPTSDVCRAVSSSTNIVCSGEIIQTHQRLNFEMDLKSYFKVVQMKTAELFGLACELGGSLAGGSRQAVASLKTFGLALGTAYQIYDDCLDLYGDQSRSGKSLGTDLASGKLTLPLLLTLERASQQERLRLRDLITAWEPEQLPAVLEVVERHDGLNRSQSVVRDYLEKAGAALATLPETSARKSLSTLSGFLRAELEALPR